MWEAQRKREIHGNMEGLPWVCVSQELGRGNAPCSMVSRGSSFDTRSWLGLKKAGLAAESWFLFCTAQGVPEALPKPAWSLWEPRDSSLSHPWLGGGECRYGVTSLYLCAVTGMCEYKGIFSNAALEVCQRKEK